MQFICCLLWPLSALQSFFFSASFDELFCCEWTSAVSAVSLKFKKYVCLQNLWFTFILILTGHASTMFAFGFVSWLGPKWWVSTRTFVKKKLKSLIWHTRGIQYTVFPILTSLWCNDKSVDVRYPPLDILMTEGSLHALFCSCNKSRGTGGRVLMKPMDTQVRSDSLGLV